ncbi:acyltransferase family protein [Kineosporia sp. J2-2]|uniref:Acyltransferase family protein n=1 Tax=Kineosporia corallincola TaxID=2835133 RepID=A0ABS5TH67_9ACTN|nr:acyltransferase [Kineosporia corallincola]MBT0769739.1 acyltransferase family protein [Kineosporia corallincola]
MADLDEPGPALGGRRAARRASAGAGSGVPDSMVDAEPLPQYRDAVADPGRPPLPAITAPTGMPVLDVLRHRAPNTRLPEFSRTPPAAPVSPTSLSADAVPQQYLSRADRRRAEALAAGGVTAGGSDSGAARAAGEVEVGRTEHAAAGDAVDRADGSPARVVQAMALPEPLAVVTAARPGTSRPAVRVSNPLPAYADPHSGADPGAGADTGAEPPNRHETHAGTPHPDNAEPAAQSAVPGEELARSSSPEEGSGTRPRRGRRAAAGAPDSGTPAIGHPDPTAPAPVGTDPRPGSSALSEAAARSGEHPVPGADSSGSVSRSTYPAPLSRRARRAQEQAARMRSVATPTELPQPEDGSEELSGNLRDDPATDEASYGPVTDEFPYDPLDDDPLDDDPLYDQPSYDDPPYDRPAGATSPEPHTGDEPASGATGSARPETSAGYDEPLSGALPNPQAFWVRDDPPRPQRQQPAAARVSPETDGLWLKNLSRPATPESLFQPGQYRRGPQPGYADPRQALGHLDDDVDDPERPWPSLHREPADGRPSLTGHPSPAGRPAPHRDQTRDPVGHPASRPGGRPDTDPRLGWIDTARGLAIVLVVFIHASEWVQETTVSVPLWDQVNAVLGSLRMPVFFLCAGILATRWLYASWSDLLARKVLLLGWVYLLWQVISSFEAIVASRITGEELAPVRMLVSLAATPAQPRFELWFVWALAVFFVVARFCSRFSLAPQLGVSALLAALTLSSLVPEINPGWNGVLKYYLFFLVGCYYGPLFKALAARMTRSVGLALIAGWLLVAVVAQVSGAAGWPVVGLAVQILGLVAGLGLALLLQDVKLLSHLGSNTMPIYLAHTPLLVLMAVVLHPIADSGAVQGIKWLLPALLTAPAIWLALLLHDTLMKTPARVLYEPPEQTSDLIWNLVADRRSGLYSERLDPAFVPGLHQRPLDRQLERLLR